MRSVRAFVLLVISFSVLGCASYFKRKECEKTNWYAHGEKLALNGDTLEADPFLNECRRVEGHVNEVAIDQGYKAGRTDYCKPQTVFLTGKRGEKFRPSMCDGEPMKLLQSKYAAGVAEYCRPSNGMAAGQSGRKYQNVCPADTERDFLPEFNKGRKKYLQGMIVSKEGQAQDIERSIRDLEYKKQELYLRMAAAPRTNVVVRDRKIENGRVRDTVKVKEGDAAQDYRAQIDRQINDVNWQIQQKRREQDAILAEIRTLQQEMATL